MRVLVVTNMWPSERDPARGVFVRDQVDALGERPGLEVHVSLVPSGGLRSYLRGARDLRRAHAGTTFDLVHAHFGLTAWPALRARAGARVVTFHGTDLRHPRSRRISLAALPFLDLPAAASASLARLVPGAGVRRRVAVLPCGVDMGRFRPIAREQAREHLGLDPAEPFLLFPADPSRAGKRHDLALRAAGGVKLHALGRVPPERVPLWVNAANAVVLPSDAEGFGLAVLEALACDVPVAATPVGIHPLALAGIEGCHCGPFDEAAWRAALAPHLASDDPRVAGRGRAELFSAGRMASRVEAAWRGLAGTLEGG